MEKTGGGPSPKEPPELPGEVVIGPPNEPHPATFPGAPGSHDPPGFSGEPIPRTWPPQSHTRDPSNDPMIDHTNNNLTLHPPQETQGKMHN